MIGVSTYNLRLSVILVQFEKFCGALHFTVCVLVLPGVFELASGNGIMTILFALSCIILGIGAATGMCMSIFINPDHLLKFANGYVVI